MRGPYTLAPILAHEIATLPPECRSGKHRSTGMCCSKIRLVPGLFFFLGVTPPGTDPKKAAPNHSPRFYADEAPLVLGVRLLANLAVDQLNAD